MGERVDRVEMEEVEHGGAHLRYALVGVGDGDVPERVPLVHDEAGLDVDLLEDAVVDQPVAGTAEGLRSQCSALGMSHAVP